MALQPRSVRELVDLMMDDARLMGRMRDIVTEADKQIEDKLLVSLQQFIRDNDLSLASIGHPDVTKAIKTFYRDARLDGNYVKLW